MACGMKLSPTLVVQDCSSDSSRQNSLWLWCLESLIMLLFKKCSSMDDSSVLVKCWAVFTIHCRALQLRKVLLPYQVVKQSVQKLWGVHLQKLESIQKSMLSLPSLQRKMSCCLCDDVSVVSSSKVLANVNPEEPAIVDVGVMSFFLSPPVIHNQLICWH